jgi:hypothetical protein
MNKLLLSFLLLFLATAWCASSQIPAEHSSVVISRGRNFVKRFQLEVGGSPSSFMIKAYGEQGKGIADYLLGTYPTMENAYLHIYFGLEQGESDLGEGGGPLLVITGAKLANNTPGGKAYLQHDIRKSGFWATSRCEHACKSPFDLDFDQTDRNRVADISGNSDGVIDTAVARTSISAFQQMNCNEHHDRSRDLQTESVVLCANDIRAYLRKYPEVVYLQFYMAVKPLHNSDNFTLVMVGLDQVGHRIWDRNEDGVPCVFNRGISCPGCSIAHDNRIDYHSQR